MGTFSIWHWLIVLAVVLVLFGGGGKISRLMGDFGKGLKSFKKGMKEEEQDVVDEGGEKKALKSEQVDSTDTEMKKEEVAKD
jgi:sec-independent protein translocase protein TatA